MICICCHCSGLEILHRREGIITEADCERIGSAINNIKRLEVVAPTIPAKSISEVLKICEIGEKYQLLNSYGINKIKGGSVCDLYIIHLDLILYSFFYEMVVFNCVYN